MQAVSIYPLSLIRVNYISTQDGNVGVYKSQQCNIYVEINLVVDAQNFHVKQLLKSTLVYYVFI